LFSGKTKRIATKVTEALLADFRMAFILSKYLNSETGRLSFPFDFFSDEYVRGFVTGYIATMVSIMFHDQRLTYKQRDDISFRVWDQIAGNDALQLIKEIAKINDGNQSEFEEFFRGYDEATYYVGTRLGMKPREGMDSPILKEARDMAATLHGTMIDLSISDSQVSTSTSTASALFLLTIKNHVTQNYLS
jgi:hypothetical protein